MAMTLKFFTEISRMRIAKFPSNREVRKVDQIVRLSRPAHHTRRHLQPCSQRAALSFVTWHAHLRGPRANRYAPRDAQLTRSRNRIKYTAYILPDGM